MWYVFSIFFAFFSLELLAAPRCSDLTARLSTKLEKRFEIRGMRAEHAAQFLKSTYIESLGFEKVMQSNQARVKEQELEAERFLEDMFLALNGDASRLPVREVRIIPATRYDERLQLQDDRLTLPLHYDSLGRYKIMTAEEIRNQWDRGSVVDNRSRTEKLKFWTRNPAIVTAWPYLNPVGHVRTLLRRSLDEVKLDFLPRIRKVKEELKEGRRSGGLEALLKMTEKEARLKALSDGELLRFLNNLESEIQDPDLSKKMEDAAIRQSAVVQKKKSQKMNVAIVGGLVAIGNYHDIDVSLFGSPNEFDQYVNVVEEPFEVNASVISGLVSVYTVDRIHVAVSYEPGALIKAAVKRLTPD